MRKINIAIVGLGNIGTYLFKYLRNNKDILSKKNNCIPNVIYVSAKNKKKKRSISLKKTQWLSNYIEATKKKEIPFCSASFDTCRTISLKLAFANLK